MFLVIACLSDAIFPKSYPPDFELKLAFVELLSENIKHLLES